MNHRTRLVWLCRIPTMLELWRLSPRSMNFTVHLSQWMYNNTGFFNIEAALMMIPQIPIKIACRIRVPDPRSECSRHESDIIFSKRWKGYWGSIGTFGNWWAHSEGCTMRLYTRRSKLDICCPFVQVESTVHVRVCTSPCKSFTRAQHEASRFASRVGRVPRACMQE